MSLTSLYPLPSVYFSLNKDTGGSDLDAYKGNSVSLELITLFSF